MTQPTAPRKGIIVRYVAAGLCCGLVAIAAPFAANALSDADKANELAALGTRYGRLVEEPEALQRVRAIDAEIATPSAPAWAGRYHMGDGLGVNVTLYVAPGSGVAVTNSTDAEGFFVETGSVAAHSDGSLHFAFDRPHAAPLSESDVMPVRWGGRRYLIGYGELPGFLHAINRNQVPSHSLGAGRYLVAENVSARKAEPAQVLPPGYAGWVRTKAATATVLTARRDNGVTTHGRGYLACASWQATLAVDKADGLHADELLDAEDPDGGRLLLALGRVDGGQATGRIFRRDDCGDAPPDPKAGLVFTTGAYDPAAVRR